MKAFLIVTAIWVLLIGSGVLGFFAWTRWLPSSITDSVAGWKTKAVGIVVAISPDIVNFLTFIQLIGGDYAPSESMTWIMRGIGTTITVLRYVTDHENE
jgi:hypothetical protein